NWCFGCLGIDWRCKRSDGGGGRFAPPVDLALGDESRCEVGGEQYRGGKHIDLPLPGCGALAVEQDGEGDRQRLEEAPHPDVRLGDTDGENLELRGGSTRGQSGQRRQFPAAGDTPAGEIVDQHRSAALIGQRYRAAVEALQRKWRQGTSGPGGEAFKAVG